jgi:hypothetical protein
VFTKEEFEKSREQTQEWRAPEKPLTKDEFAAGGEKDFFKELPRTATADAARALFATFYDIGDATTHLVPYLRYAVDWDKEKEAFLKLDKQAQVNQLLWDAFDATLLTLAPKAAGNIWRAGGGALKTVSGGVGEALAKSRGAKLIKPVEDISSWPEMDYFKQLRKTLRGRDYGLSDLEALSVEGFLKGSKRALSAPVLNQPGGKVSKGFAKLLKAEGDKLGLTDDALEELSPLAVRRKKFISDYSHALYDKLGVYGKARTDQMYSKDIIGAERIAFPKIIEKIYGKTAAEGIELASATDEQIVAAREFLRGYMAKSLVKRAVNTPLWAYQYRIATTFGKGEPAYGLLSKVYLPVEQAGEAVSRYKGEKLVLFDEMMVQNGFFKKVGEKIKVIPERLNRRVEKRALEFMRKFAQIEKEAEVQKLAAQRPELKKAIQEMIPLKSAEDYAVRDLIVTLNDFSDKMQAEFLWHNLQSKVFLKQVNALGNIELEGLMNKIAPDFWKIFNTSSGLNATQKNAALEQILQRMRLAVKTNGKHWYSSPGWSEATKIKVIDRLEGSLKLGTNKIPFYRTSFFQRPPSYKAQIMTILHGEESKIWNEKGASMFYSELEKLGMRKELSLEREIIKRISDQAQFLHFAPALRRAAYNAKHLPPSWKKYTEHYLSRKLHLPSRADAYVAKTIERTFGGAQRMAAQSEALRKLLPKANWEGVYDAYDVVNLAKKVNDITYMAFLGGKPFSAMRNLFQPWLLVPTDLGGFRDIGTLAKSYGKLFTSKTFRKEIEALGVIPTEFSGEFANATHAVLRTRGSLLGAPIPRAEEFKSALMYMFSKSHIGNCYVSGGAAILKWDGALAAVGRKSIKGFMKKAGVFGRRDAIRARIETLLRNDQWEAARKLFTQSVVEDTQFLYTSGSTPLVTQSLGGVGRTGAIFQTWWLNYVDTLSKWVTTGTPEMKTARALNFVATNYIALELMTSVWGEGTAKRTTFLGPMPTPGERLSLPPAWDAMVQVLRTTMTAANLIGSKEKTYSENVDLQVSRLLKTSFEFLPAGLQLTQSIKRTEEEGAKGFIKSLVKWKKDPAAPWER